MVRISKTFRKVAGRTATSKSGEKWLAEFDCKCIYCPFTFLKLTSFETVCKWYAAVGFTGTFPRSRSLMFLHSKLAHHFKTFIRTKLFFSLSASSRSTEITKSFGKLSSEAELLFPQPTFGPVTFFFKTKISSKNRLLYNDNDRLTTKDKVATEQEVSHYSTLPQVSHSFIFFTSHSQSNGKEKDQAISWVLNTWS